MSPAARYDVVVIGSGSAGGVVASRLSEDEGCSVLLLEAGRDFPDEAAAPPPWFAGGAHAGERGTGAWPPDPALDWGYESEPLENGRRVPLRRGRLVGGTSMANTCIAVRGRPEDFDRWVAAGATGWSFADLLPHLERVERELNVHTHARETWLPVQELVLDGFEELGFAFREDSNEPDAWDGVVGPWPRSRRNEIRLGTLNTYIRRARPRPNFTLEAGALVDRVLFDGLRATGVSYVRDGARHEVGAERVVVSAGAYGSAPILLRSGIGPPAELRALGIEPLVDLPVGAHLMEHPACAFQIAVDPPFARLGWPTLAAVARGEGWWAIPMPWDEEAGLVQVNFCLAWTDGPNGSIRLASARPEDPPLIDHGFQAVVDGDGFAGAWRDFERLLGTDALRRAGARDPHEGTPLRERLLRGLATSAHPAGGCDIGTVVGPDLAVHGVEGLFVADASVFPRHVTNNPNVTIFAIGEVAAALLRQGRYSVKPES